MSGNRSKSAFFEWGWVTLSADFRGKGASPTNHSWHQSSRVIDCPFVWYENICSASFSFVTIHACDRRTDRQTDGRTDRITAPKTALAYARAVKTLEWLSKSHKIISITNDGNRQNAYRYYFIIMSRTQRCYHLVPFPRQCQRRIKLRRQMGFTTGVEPPVVSGITTGGSNPNLFPGSLLGV